MTTQGDLPSDPETQDLFCPGCGYNLRGLSDPAKPTLQFTCPECGVAIDRQKLAEERIPWAYRDEIGRRHAFWRTANFVMRHPKRFGGFVAGPVDGDAAEAFRRAVVWHAFIPVAIVAMGTYAWSLWQPMILLPSFQSGYFVSPPQLTGINTAPGAWAGRRVLGWMLEGLLAASFLPAIWLALDGVTRLSSLFFRTSNLGPEQQERAAAMSYYSCAVLAPTPFILSPLAVALLIAVSPLADRIDVQAIFILVISTEVLILAQMLVWLFDTVAILRVVTRSGGGRLLAATALLPTLGLLLGGLILFLIPALAGLIGLIVLSFD